MFHIPGTSTFWKRECSSSHVIKWYLRSRCGNRDGNLAQTQRFSLSGLYPSVSTAWSMQVASPAHSTREEDHTLTYGRRGCRRCTSRATTCMGSQGSGPSSWARRRGPWRHGAGPSARLLPRWPPPVPRTPRPPPRGRWSTRLTPPGTGFLCP